MTILPESIATEIQKLAPSAVIELFELDATSIGGDIVRFHAGTNQLRQNVVWQGETYSRFPIEATGFEFTGTGPFPRPKIKVSNILSAITTLLLESNDLLGAKLTRKRTLAKFLDAENFTGGVNPTADDEAEIPDDIYFIDRKSSEDRDVVEFELAAAVDLVGVTVPRRAIIQNICVWEYRGPECGYTGSPLFDVNDQPIANTAHDSSEAHDVVTRHSFKRDSEDTVRSTQAALSQAAINRDVACAIVKTSTQYHEPPLFAPPIAGDYFIFARTDTGALSAYWNGVAVSIGTVYRQGKLKNNETISNGITGKLYEIEQWGSDAGACSTATTAYNSALTARNNAQSDLETAQDDADTADAALQPEDDLFSRERCGKRLASCKLRFGATAELPFGSFPACGLFK